MMILIIGFTCPPTIHFKFNYYKVRQVVLQSAIGITKCDNLFKVRQVLYHRVPRLLKSATEDTLMTITSLP